MSRGECRGVAGERVRCVSVVGSVAEWGEGTCVGRSLVGV